MEVIKGVWNVDMMNGHHVSSVSPSLIKGLPLKRMSVPDITDQVWKKPRLMCTLQVLEQPRSLGIPFVQHTDLPSVSSYIVGEKSTADKTTHPSLLLANYNGPVQLVWYLVADDVRYPHPYVLEGVDCQDGVCTKTILAKGEIISFPGLYVRSVSREDIQKTLERRLDILKEHLPGTKFKLKDPTEYNLSAVRIGFQFLFPNGNRHHESLSLLTKSLRSKEPSLHKEPRILSISECKGSVLGREELTLRVANLKTDDVFVFFHCESTAPRSSWQAFAEVISISRQRARPVDVVVKTPPYPDHQISEPQTVAIQIRLMNDSLSNTMKYTYIPKLKEPARSEQRVKVKEPIYVKYFTCLGASTDVNPVLEMTDEKNGTKRSRNTNCKQFFVYKRENLRKERRAKPHKVNAGSQTEERYLRSGGSLEGYDSEEELGESDDRVDYDRLERYRTLMMGSESSSPTPLTNGIEARPRRGSGFSSMDFTPRGVLGSSQSLKSNSTGSVLRHAGDSGSSPHSGSNVTSGSLIQHLSQISLSPTTTDSIKETFKDMKSAACHDLEELEDGTANDRDTVECTATSTYDWMFGRHQCHFVINGSSEVKEIVLRSPGAINLPDLTGCGLHPAIVDEVEFPVRVNDAGSVAVKDIESSLFQEEAFSLWSRLKHGNLISSLGMIKEGARRCLVLEFPEEGCLEGYLSKTDPASILPNNLWKWTLQAGEALQYLHESGLAHQEITLGNCLIAAGGDLKLNIPTDLIKSKTFPKEAAAVRDEEFERGQVKDVLSFSILVRILLENCSLSEDIAKSLDSFGDECTQEDTSRRPNIQQVVKKLRRCNQQLSETSGNSAVPPLKVAPPSPHQYDTNQAGDIFSTVLEGCFTDPIPHSPDSGIGAATGSKKSGLLSVCPERTDSETSRESAFSDSSQKSEETLHAESLAQGQVEAEATDQTDSPEGNEPSGDETPTQTQESVNGSDDEDMETPEESSEGGQGGSDRHEGWHEENDREDNSLSSHLCPPRVVKRVDHTGDTLELYNGEISLEIPPGALPEGQAEDITLTLDWNDKHIPPLRPSDMSVAPIVQCGPTGLHFEKPVQLKLPHCAVLQDPKRCKMTVHCSQTEEGEMPHWSRISKPQESNMEVECKDGSFILLVRHFTSFTVSLDGGEEVSAKEIMFVPYGEEIATLEDNQQIRIYLYNFHSSNREQILQEEKYLGGKQLSAPKAYHLLKLPEAGRGMFVEVEYYDPSWLLRSSLKTEFLFRKLWNLQSYDLCQFTWSNKSGSPYFLCRFVAQQLDNDEKVLLELSNHVKMPPESLIRKDTAQNSASGSGVPENWQPLALVTTQSSTCSVTGADVGNPHSMPQISIDKVDQINVFPLAVPPSSNLSMPLPPGSPPLIPHELMLSLAEKLDQIHLFGSDWRKLASDFGYDKYILSLQSKSQSPHFSPTYEILKLMCQEKKIKSLTKLEEYFRKITRKDVACLIAAYQAAHAGEEDMITSETPSPDEVKRPLTPDQRPFEDAQGSPSPDLLHDISNRPDAVNQEVPDTLSLELANNNKTSEGLQDLANSNERHGCFGTPVDATPMMPGSCHKAIGQMDENMENIEQGVCRILFK